jgi:hypothetical protein
MIACVFVITAQAIDDASVIKSRNHIEMVASCMLVSEDISQLSSNIPLSRILGYSLYQY